MGEPHRFWVVEVGAAVSLVGEPPVVARVVVQMALSLEEVGLLGVLLGLLVGPVEALGDRPRVVLILALTCPVGARQPVG